MRSRQGLPVGWDSCYLDGDIHHTCGSSTTIDTSKLASFHFFAGRKAPMATWTCRDMCGPRGIVWRRACLRRGVLPSEMECEKTGDVAVWVILLLWRLLSRLQSSCNEPLWGAALAWHTECRPRRSLAKRRGFSVAQISMTCKIDAEFHGAGNVSSAIVDTLCIDTRCTLADRIGLLLAVACRVAFQAR
jgi:hypothetical protein